MVKIIVFSQIFLLALDSDISVIFVVIDAQSCIMILGAYGHLLPDVSCVFQITF